MVKALVYFYNPQLEKHQNDTLISVAKPEGSSPVIIKSPDPLLISQ